LRGIMHPARSQRKMTMAMTEDAGSSIPELDITWREPWRQLEDAEHQRRLQDELEREVGLLHPLWSAGANVFALRVDQDDVAVRLADGRFAVVHLVWRGRIDGLPDEFPWTRIFDTLSSFQRAIDVDADDWAHTTPP